MTRLIFVAAAALASFATAATAHPHLNAAGPAPASVVKTSPKALRLQFNEPIEIAFSGIEVTNEKGEKQATGTAIADKAQLVVPLKATLAPGKYTVAWHAVGDDTHRVKGAYTFSVKK
jgi:copper resistance protein C